MDMQRIVRGGVGLLRYALAMAGTFAFLMVLPPAPFLEKAEESFLVILYAAVATAAAFPIVLGAEHLLGGKRSYRWHLYIPLVLWLVLTAAGVALGTLLPFPVIPLDWGRYVPGRMYPALSGVLNFCLVAMLMPPLTFWVLLGTMRRILGLLAAALPKMAPYLVRA